MRGLNGMKGGAGDVSGGMKGPVSEELRTAAPGTFLLSFPVSDRNRLAGRRRGLIMSARRVWPLAAAVHSPRPRSEHASVPQRPGG